MKRRTQTNEPARCATLLPLLALLPQPLALLEVGASAGLCLLPDLYGYEYNQTVHISPRRRSSASDVYVRDKRGNAHPHPKYRRGVATGLDLEPLRVNDSDDAAWLEALVWPGEQDRCER